MPGIWVLLPLVAEVARKLATRIQMPGRLLRGKTKLLSLATSASCRMLHGTGGQEELVGVQ